MGGFGGFGRYLGSFFGCILMFFGFILGSGGSLKVVVLMWLREDLAVCDNMGLWSPIYGIWVVLGGLGVIWEVFLGAF